MVKIQSMKIENLNDETTPEKPDNQFVPIMWGIIQQQLVIKICARTATISPAVQHTKMR